MNNILSGEQIVQAHSKTICELPLVGLKEFEPNQSWLEQKQIQSALDQRKTLLETERIEKESNLMTAEWRVEKLKALVSRKGKLWEVFGHHADDADWLFPEEVLFLMELGCLECFFGQVPLSIQKGYSVLLSPKNGCSIDEYRVYAHLCRAGYRLVRHSPTLTVTAYERTIRLDQHLKKHKNFSDKITEGKTPEDVIIGNTDVSKKELCTLQQTSHESEDSAVLIECTEPKATDRSIEKSSREKGNQDNNESQLSKVLNETVPYRKTVTNESDETVISKEEMKRLNVTKTNIIVGLTKRRLRKIQRKRLQNFEFPHSVQGSKDVLSRQRRSRRKWLSSVLKKYKHHLIVFVNSKKRHKGEQDPKVDQFNRPKEISTSFDKEERPEIPSERWRPPVVISDLPENIEMRIESKPFYSEKNEKEEGDIEVIDIADTSSEEEETDESEESDSDIEIIQEIKPQSQEEEEEESDDLEIIEVPVTKKDIIVETLSSDSENEEDSSDSESEKSYDGNWKRMESGSAKNKKFVRPPTMSKFTFAAVEEFCAEKKSIIDNHNKRDNSNINENDGEFIRLDCLNSGRKRPVFRVDLTRNEILDLMPTMAGVNKKLMTLDIPDLRLIPDSITPKQQSYTYSTNVLKARVFRQGFRGRRNFHGARFPSFNPYYNNTSGNFFPNQLSVGGPQGLFQTPQLTQMLNGGDISSVARGVMQIASALLMNIPQNNMNNGMLPYTPRPQFPMITPNYPRIESSDPPLQQFPGVNQNFAHNEPPTVNYRGYNGPQRNHSNFQNMFDMPDQRNFGTPSHIRFSDNDNVSSTENRQSVDLTQSLESDFDSRDHNFTPPSGGRYNAGRNSRENRAANFRSNRGRLQRKHYHGKGRIVPRDCSSNPSQWIDPAYIKPDVPVPNEHSFSQGEYIPISSNSNHKPVEIVSIDDDDSFVPRGGVSSRFCGRKRLKRKLMRMNKKAKKKCINANVGGKDNPEIVFLDSPSVSSSTLEDFTSNPVKQEKDVHVKIENVKEETPLVSNLKRESIEASTVKLEKEMESRVKTEVAFEENRSVRVKVESGQNVSVDIKIESSSDTPSDLRLPILNNVKAEPLQVKQEKEVEVKKEGLDVIDSLKTESANEEEGMEGTLTLTNTNSEVIVMEADTSETPQLNSAEICSENERTRQQSTDSVPDNHTKIDTEVEMEEESDIVSSSKINSEINSRTELNSEEVVKKKVSSWGEIKKNNLILSTIQNSEVQVGGEHDDDDEDENDNEEEEEKPILRPKHCKSIGTVLSALQIFAPFNRSPPEAAPVLKISFDLYPPAEFRKAHRGLPQYRIVVFNGSEPLPSPAQLREVNSRFQDQVPVLTAVVTPASVVFYTFTDIHLPQDSSSYK